MNENFLNVGTLLSREDAKMIHGGRIPGSRCVLYCCTRGGNCSDGIPMETTNALCQSNEDCQEAGNSQGYTCEGNTYLAALCKG